MPPAAASIPAAHSSRGSAQVRRRRAEPSPLSKQPRSERMRCKLKQPSAQVQSHTCHCLHQLESLLCGNGERSFAVERTSNKHAQPANQAALGTKLLQRSDHSGYHCRCELGPAARANTQHDSAMSTHGGAASCTRGLHLSGLLLLGSNKPDQSFNAPHIQLANSHTPTQ